MRIRDLNITKKLVLIQLFTAVLVLLLCLVSFIVSDILQYRELKQKNLMSVANVIATNSTSSIEFEDEKAAQEFLDDLRSQPDILNAFIYHSDGRIFASYHSTAGDTFQLRREKIKDKPYYSEGRFLVTCADVHSGNRKIGMVCLRTEMNIFRDILSSKLKISAAILLFGAILALLIGQALQKYISSPILRLSSFMKEISRTNNYRNKIDYKANDEIGLLSNSFNNLLDQIRERDEVLIDQNTLLNSILINSADGVIVIDLDGIITMSNPSANQLFGIDLKGKNIMDVIENGDFRNYIGQRIFPTSDLFSKPFRGEVIKEELQRVYGDNEEVWMLCTAAPLFDNRKIINGAVAILSDITGIKNVNKQLERRIFERTVKLTDANRNLTEEIERRKEAEKQLAVRAAELQRSNSELQQFAYVASHDLQEPLRMISSFTQLLSKRYKNKLDTDADEYINYVIDGANRMKLLIDDLLEFSRVTSRAKPFMDCDMDDVVRDVQTNVREMLIEKNVKIIIGKKLPVIAADKMQMMQVLQNLITNGIKFQPPGQSAVINIDYTEDEQYWTFEVKDNGIGIKEEFSEKVFVIFQRLHTQKSYPGSGIGLSICKKIVERHGGKIWFYSKPGHGTSFFFTIDKNLPKN